MPLDQHIEGGHGERQARLTRRPAPMPPLFAMADERQHHEHRLHQHTVLPLAALTHFEMAWIALRGMEAGITQDNHLFFERSFWIPGSWHLRMGYTDAIPFCDPSQESNRAG